MAQMNSAVYSQDGQYFAFYHTDGKLKIWDTTEGVLKQEYTPNEHLTLPCSALAWVTLPHSSKSPGRKKKRRTDEEGGSGGQMMLLLGLKSGCVLLYSLGTGKVECELQGPGLSAAVRSLTWANGDASGVYSGCADGTIAHWNLPSKQLSSKWRAGRGPVTALISHPKNPWLLSASQNVILWDREHHTELKCFSGHASPVSSLLLVPEGGYVVSIACQDRHINVWPLENSKSNEVAASFVLPDHPVGADIGVSEEEGCVRLVVVTEGGALNIFSRHFNGVRLPPMKPCLTVQIASSDDTANASAINSIPIVGAKVCADNPSSVYIAHGDPVVLRFEKISMKTSKEVMWLVRQNSRRIIPDEQKPSTSKVKIASNTDKAHYVTAAGVKRPRNVSAKQLPIEQRINNLSMSTEQPKSKAGPSSDSLAHLLSQGLQSSDQKLLRGILLTKDSSTVASTVARLSPAQVPVLVQELTVLVHWRGWKGEAAARWLHAILVHHGALVLASPELPQLVIPLLGLVEARLSQMAPLARLRGRLSLLLGQLAHGRTAKGSQQSATPAHEQTPLLHYQDGEESSSDELSLLEDSDSEQRWDEGVDQDESDDEDDDTPLVNGDLSDEEVRSSGEEDDENMELSS